MRQRSDYCICKHRRHPLLQRNHRSRKENDVFKSLGENKSRETKKVFSKGHRQNVHEMKSRKWQHILKLVKSCINCNTEIILEIKIYRIEQIILTFIQQTWFLCTVHGTSGSWKRKTKGKMLLNALPLYLKHLSPQSRTMLQKSRFTTRTKNKYAWRFFFFIFNYF